MIRLAIVVEGQTEEAFVNELLSPHLTLFEVLPTPVLIGASTRRERKGGNVSLQRVVDTARMLIHNFDAVTTLVDYYAYRDRPSDDVDELQRIMDHLLDRAMQRPVRKDRVFAYVQRHEFEALLFSDPLAFERALALSSEVTSTLHSVRSGFGTPEDINDKPESAPSKRILREYPSYSKTLDGILVAKETGLDVMRKECPRFGDWLTRLEGLNGEAWS